MSTRLSGPPPEKKISSWVRPGVREMRAKFLRPVRALIRLDLPTLERPDSAISVPRIGGSDTGEPAAAENCQSTAKSLRPASSWSRVNSSIGTAPGGGRTSLRRNVRRIFCQRLGRLLFHEQRFDIVDEFDFGAVFAHDDALLKHRQRIVPGPVDNESGRETRQHEGENHRHPVEDHLLRRVWRRRI